MTKISTNTSTNSTEVTAEADPLGPSLYRLGFHPWRIFATRHPWIEIDPWRALPDGTESVRDGDRVQISAALPGVPGRRSALARVLAEIERETAGLALADPDAEAAACAELAARWLIPLPSLADAEARAPYGQTRQAEILWCDERALADRIAGLTAREHAWLDHQVDTRETA